MVDFVLYILKINLLTTIGICLVHVLSKLVKSKYSSWWRYYMWLVFSVVLIIPFGLLPETKVVSFEIPYQKVTYETNAEDLTVDSPAPDQAPSVSLVAEGKAGLGVQNLSVLTLVDYTDIFMYVWIGGIIVLSFIRILHYQISVYYLRRWAVSCGNSDYLSTYKKICKMMGTKRYPGLLVSLKLSSPVLAGLIRPVLYIPDTDYTEHELKLIYHHELSHYQNKDLLYKLFFLIINTVYWFNPALYFMRKEADKDIEYLCDSSVIKICSGRERIAYHKLILKTAAEHNCVHYISASLNDDMTDFKERIMYMMKEKSLKKGKFLVVMLVALMVVANLLVGCSGKKIDNNDKKDTTVIKAETDNPVDEPEDMKETETEKKNPADEPEDTEETDASNETTDAKDLETTPNSNELSNNSAVDKSGDYIGDISSPNPPQESSYRVHSNDASKAVVIHVSNLDSANIKFYLTTATQKEGVESENHMDTYTESVIFNEHIAHYNGDGYYEYIGKDYHLYFKYNTGMGVDVSDYTLSVYGLESLFDLSQYGDVINYNGINGIKFIMGLPFAG